MVPSGGSGAVLGLRPPDQSRPSTSPGPRATCLVGLRRSLVRSPGQPCPRAPRGRRYPRDVPRGDRAGCWREARHEPRPSRSWSGACGATGAAYDSIRKGIPPAPQDVRFRGTARSTVTGAVDPPSSRRPGGFTAAMKRRVSRGDPFGLNLDDDLREWYLLTPRAQEARPTLPAARPVAGRRSSGGFTANGAGRRSPGDRCP